MIRVPRGVTERLECVDPKVHPRTPNGATLSLRALDLRAIA